MQVISSQTHTDLARVTEEEWTDLWKRLRFFAHIKYAQLRDKTIDGGDLDDFVKAAIVDTLSGKRGWPPLDKKGKIKNITLFFFLCQVVRSKVSNGLAKEKRRTPIDSIPDPPPIQLTLDGKGIERQAIYNEFCSHLRKLVCEDNILIKIVDLLTVTPDIKTKDIADRLDLPPMTVRAAERRLHRMILKIAEEY